MTKPLYTAGLLIGIGIFFVLINLQLIHISIWKIIKFWPLILIFIGIELILRYLFKKQK